MDGWYGQSGTDNNGTRNLLQTSLTLSFHF